MSRRKHRKGARRVPPAKPSARRAVLLAATGVFAVGILAGVVLFRGGGPTGTGLPSTPAAGPAARAAPSPPAAGSDFGMLKGRWLRPDGGYTLEIRNVAAGGTMDAAYLNPRPIHVARAEATREGSALKVVVELRAPGYPGSTYTLAYDPQRDRLTGTYFQAALRQSYDVFFVRVQ